MYISSETAYLTAWLPALGDALQQPGIGIVVGVMLTLYILKVGK